MLFEEIRKSCYYVYAPEWEVFFSVYALLNGEEKAPIFKHVSREIVQKLKNRYRFLFEAYHTIQKINFMGMPECLLNASVQPFSSTNFESEIQKLAPADFLFQYLDWDAWGNIEELKQSLVDDNALDLVFQKVEDLVENSLGFFLFFRQTERYRREFFALADEIRNLVSSTFILSEKDLMIIREKIHNELKEPLEYSQYLMGKTFRNRGPYSDFYFCPISNLPVRVVRYFHTKGKKKTQILFFSPHSTKSDSEHMLTTLKTVADPMRYQILRLLAEETPLRGLDIAQKLSISTPTVSHHMELLKQSRLIHEEPVKNSKYYSVNKHSLSELIQMLKTDFHIE